MQSYPSPAASAGRRLRFLKTKPIKNYIGIWLMFYINITCGLALISQEKMIIKCIGLVGAVGILSSVTAVFNAGGRLGFSAWADTMKDRNTIYKLIFVLSIVLQLFRKAKRVACFSSAYINLFSLTFFILT